MAHRSISLEDIKSVPEALSVLENGTEEEFKQLLYDIGFDIKRNIEKQTCYHRNMVNKDVIFTDRWVGQERKDEEWINSEYCTRENKLEYIGIKDSHLLRELLVLDKRPNFTEMIISHMQGDVEDINIKFVEEEVEDEQH